MKFITFFMGLVLSFSSFALIYKNHKATLESFEDYERCHQRKFPSAACQEALDNWLKTNPKDTIEAARKTSVLMNARVAVPLFYKAFRIGDNSKVSCEDPKL
ncbi:MAG: hypothetical protein NXH75_09500, partial [Halobacteriovoraceae bacterium]|nr:hypothetical protein [Halobacteriovoraceae bacterium]